MRGALLSAVASAACAGLALAGGCGFEGAGGVTVAEVREVGG